MSGYTPGPWEWFGNTKTKEIHLATSDRGRIYVMNFVRWGMADAQPRFQRHDIGVMVKAEDLVQYERTYRKDFRGINHPDARLIAAAPDLLADLLAVSTDNAQDAIEDPVGHAEREAAGFYRIGKGAIDAVRAAIAKAEGAP